MIVEQINSPKDQSITFNQRLFYRSKAFLLYCIFQIIQDVVLLYYTANQNLFITLPKLLLDLLIVLLSISLKQNFMKQQDTFMILVSRLIQCASFMALNRRDFMLMILSIGIEIQTIDIQSGQLIMAEKVLQRLEVALMCLYFQFEAFTIVLIIWITIFKIFQDYHEDKLTKGDQYFNVQKQMKMSKDHSLEEIQLPDNNNYDDLWKKRLQSMPISVLMIKKQNLQITYSNKNLVKLFQSKYSGIESQIEHFILNTLQFSIVMDRLENIYSSTLVKNNKKRLRSGQEDENKLSPQDFHDLIMNQSLFNILELYNNEKYNKYIDPNTLSLDLFCSHEWRDGSHSNYSCQIIGTRADQEIIIILTDITKQNELMQKINQDDFKSKIIESFSHEMRTPLNSAINFLTSAESEQKIPQDVIVESIRPALNSLKLQSYLINDIIDFSQINSSELEVQQKEFRLNDLVTELYNLFEIHFHSKDIGFIVEFQDNNCRYMTDYTRLMQIIINLLQNAIKFTLKGCVKIVFSSTQEGFKVKITDTGIGINQERLQSIEETLSIIEQSMDFSKNKSWSGFGLIISSLLLSKLAPANKQKLRIKSLAQIEGTKVSFNIQSHKMMIHQLPKQKTLRKNKTISLQKINQEYQMKQSKIIASEYKYVTQQTRQSKSIKKKPSKGFGSHYEDSMYQQSDNDYLEYRVANLQQFNPTFIQDLNDSKSKRQDFITSPVRSQVMSIQQLRQLSDYESENNLKSFSTQKKCDCQVILSVDDDVFNQKSIQILLQKLNFRVLLAYNGILALELIRGLQKCSTNCCLLNLILMDYSMPIMDGVETTKNIIKMIENKEIPQIHVIGLTAFTSNTDVQKCLDAGMSDVLSKPLQLKEFTEILALL
ncbi:hypothetical protein pb186bvf_000583 [Paramecium bursaria]